jgi:stage II sporulation protein M
MLKKERYDGFFGGLYKRNEVYLLLSTVIFLISVLLGYALAGILSPFLAGLFGNLNSSVVQGQTQLQTLPIFLKNLDIILFIYIGGVLFGLGTAIYMVFNGFFIGYTASQYPLGNYILFNIPHGIPELIAIIISGAAGFRLASCVYHIFNGLTHMRSDISQTNQFRYIIEMNMDEFWESVSLMVIAIVLVLIASFIEANLSIAWANYIKFAI